MALWIGLLVGLSLIWAAAGFVVGYRLAQRRTPVRFIQGTPPPMPLSNTVKRGPGPADGERAWSPPTWSSTTGEEPGTGGSPPR